MPDYLPRTDNEFDRWFANFMEYSLKHWADLGFTKKELTELKRIQSAWGDALIRHHMAQASARAATDVKEKRRAAGERAIRKYVRIIQARPATTNQQRRELGITLKPDETAGEVPAQAAASSGGEIDVLGY